MSGFEYICSWRLQNLSEQPASVFYHPYTAKASSYVQIEFPVSFYAHWLSSFQWIQLKNLGSSALFQSSHQVFIHMDKMLVRVFLMQLRMPLGFFAARAYCWPKGSLVSTRPTGQVLQSCFPTCRLPVPMQGVISSQVQDFVLHFVELHEISVSSFLCYWRWIVAPVLIPGLHAPWVNALQVDLNLAVQLVFSSSDVQS